MIGIQMDDSGLQGGLDGLQGGFKDLRPVWRGPVHDIFKRFIRAVFVSENAYTGERWAPLNPAYAAWKARKYGAKGILQREDRLIRSLTEDGGEHILRVQPTQAQYGTRVPYAVYHQAVNRGKAPFPRRPIIPKPTRAEAERIVDAILGFLFKAMADGARKARRKVSR